MESALVEHPLVAEAAVVPVEHHIKGEGIYAFVTLVAGQSYPASDALRYVTWLLRPLLFKVATALTRLATVVVTLVMTYVPGGSRGRL